MKCIQNVSGFSPVSIKPAKVRGIRTMVALTGPFWLYKYTLSVINPHTHPLKLIFTLCIIISNRGMCLRTYT